MKNVTDSLQDTVILSSKETLWSQPNHSGLNYRSLLGEAHRYLQPKTYLEIGVNTGATLALSTCSSIAIDPNFLLSESVINNKPSCYFFNMTSDEFFSST